MNFKKYLIVLLSFTALYSYGQAPDPQYKLVGSNFIQTKNYYLLTLFQNNIAAKQLLSNDPELVKLGKRLSETEQEFYPVITSLQIDADEPMDP